MFVHFGVNTFTDREWGKGTEEPDIFQPVDLDCRQWARVARETGFKLMILTAKHHDGFCLWPSRFTDHSVKSSSWRDGNGDVVREFVQACRAEGLGVGLYLSPWDRNQPTYGDSPKYNQFFRNQLKELMTDYGPIDEMWFDGACGEGPNGKRQVYDWQSYYDTVYGVNPRALIAICGPDIRWVGNESGVARAGESSVRTRNGRRVWYPAECDVSIRPGWFYHRSQDDKVKSLDRLLDIYFKSVGRNSVLLLNVPPNRRGRFAEPDVRRLREFRQVLDETFAHNLARQARVTASAVYDSRSDYAPERVLDGDLDTCWAAPESDLSGWLRFELSRPVTFNVIDVQEPIFLGERVKRYHVEVETGGAWRTIAGGTVIGHRNLLRIPRTTADKLRLVIDEARACPAVAEFSVHLCPRDADWPRPSLTSFKPAKASNVHSGGAMWGADKAVDDDMGTRWATADETRECWLEVDLQRERIIERAVIREFAERVTRFRIEFRQSADETWRVAFEGEKIGKQAEARFPPRTARYVRLHILAATFAPTIWEFQVYGPEQTTRPPVAP